MGVQKDRNKVERHMAATAERRVLFVASECAPFAKCGGLGDVVASLPKALRRSGVDVRVVIPLYASIDRAHYALVPEGTCRVRTGAGEVNECEIFRATADGGVPVWFVGHDRFFARNGIYDDHGQAYSDHAFRFGLLCMAAAQVCRDRKWIPDVMHVHDWPTAVLPAMLEAWRNNGRSDGLERTGSVLTIHNQAYQGYSHSSALPYLGLDESFYTPEGFEAYGQLNLLKGGIVFADEVTTVSPTYAKEIRQEPLGCGLSMYLRRRGETFGGILNGADYDVWNPEMDEHIPAAFGAHSLIGKGSCKRALQEEMGLQVDATVPLFGMVTRLAAQKGTGLMRTVLPWVLHEMQVQLAVLGSGDPADEDFFRRLAQEAPGRLAVNIGYSEALSHRIQAGADFFLMPSEFEPCGLSQMYALRYAALPLVHATGGLEDTVAQYNEAEGAGTGFKFYSFTAQAFHDVFGWAVSTWYDRPSHITRMRERAMEERFDWEASAQHYLEVYERVAAKRR
jgi:starch synthase